MGWVIRKGILPMLMFWRPGFLRLWLRRIVQLFGLFILASTLLVLLFRYINPPTSFYLLSEQMRVGSIKRDWTPIEDFAPTMARAIVAAEDANYCLHSGFDFEAIQMALEAQGRRRGASTLSQQVAKNVFLWQGRSFLRKGLEVGYTILIEVFWPKQRIIEVYLNVAELDEGVFGAAAAAQHYFGSKPSQITELQAARLAAILPNPKARSASNPSAATRKRTRQIMSGAATINADGRASCFQPG